jgi:predicted DCC family thiol-disulfide oxidoreductase YuxK
MPHVAFYDGVCALCNRLVRFVLAHDRRDRFRFASLQGSYARRVLVGRGLPLDDLDTFVLLAEDGRLLTKSRAALFVLRELGPPWRWSAALAWLPTWLLDRGYDLVARTRYRVFGTFDACPLPEPKDRGKFLDVP